MFDIMVVVIFQSIFCLKIYQNNFFYFLKFIFDISRSNQSENIKKFNFFKKYF